MNKRVFSVKKTRRFEWPWNRWKPKRVDESLCSQCGLPHFRGSKPELAAERSENNVIAHIYRGRWPDGFAVKFSRWRVKSHRGYYSDFIPVNEMKDMLQAIKHVHGFALVEKAKQKRPSRRKVG